MFIRTSMRRKGGLKLPHPKGIIELVGRYHNTG